MHTPTPATSPAIVPASRDLQLLREVTTLQSAPQVPEIALRLAGHAHEIWQSVDARAEHAAAKRPFWAFAWPGGQAKARYVLDNPEVVAGRRVLDIGSGSGIGAIAAARAGARSVVANDVDPLALSAIGENAAANGASLELDGTDLLHGDTRDADVILLSDVVYDLELATRVKRFIDIATTRRATILYADRTTARLPARPKAQLYRMHTQVFPVLEETHFEHACVWQLA